MKTTKVYHSSKKDEWFTPQSIVDALEKYIPFPQPVEKFTLDPCACELSKKADKFFSEQEDGLKQSWAGEFVFCNPPYSRAKEFVAKGLTELNKEDVRTRIVYLLAARTDTKMFHSLINSHYLRQVLFVKGRISFIDSAGQTQQPAPFPSVIFFLDSEPFANLGGFIYTGALAKDPSGNYKVDYYY